jgi:ferredoxin
MRDQAGLIVIPTPVDLDAVRREVDEANKANVQIRRKLERAKHIMLAERYEAESKEISLRMKSRIEAKHAAIAAANLPILGLGFGDRIEAMKQAHGIGFCNITKCCTRVCPENIAITDNAIIPLKERVVDQFYDPVAKLLKLVRAKK